MAIAGECDVATVCGSDKPCAMKTQAELRTCLADCGMKVQMCVAAKLDAAKTQIQTALMDAKTRFADAQTALQTKVTDWQAKIAALKTATADQLKTACNTFCMNHMADLTAEQNTKCTTTCTGITDLKTGMQAVASLAMAAARSKYQALLEANPDKAADLMAAVQQLQDAISVQRAFLSDAQAKVATAIDAKRDQIAQARQDRQDAVQAAKDKFAAWKAQYDAADADGKAALLESGKMQLKAAIDAAKAKWDAVKAAWADTRKDVIQKVIDFKKDRRANRKIIIADLKNVKAILADLKANCAAIDGSCQVEMSAAMTKRADPVGAYVVVGCEKSDATCDLAVNTMLAGAVDADTDITVTETSADEVQTTLPTFPDETAMPTTAPTTKKGSSSASTVALSIVTLLVAVLAL